MIKFLEGKKIHDIEEILKIELAGYAKNFDDAHILKYILSKFDYTIETDISLFTELKVLLRIMEEFGIGEINFLHESYFLFDNDRGAFTLEQPTELSLVENFLNEEFSSDLIDPIHVYVARGLYIVTHPHLFIHVSSFLESAYIFSNDKDVLKSITHNLKKADLKFEILDSITLDYPDRSNNIDS